MHSIGLLQELTQTGVHYIAIAMLGEQEVGEVFEQCMLFMVYTN